MFFEYTRHISAISKLKQILIITYLLLNGYNVSTANYSSP